MKTVHVRPIFSVLHHEAAVKATMADCLATLNRSTQYRFEIMGDDRGRAASASAERTASVPETVYLVLTGGTERLVLDAVGDRPEPVILLAHPGQNSLPASLEILARLRQLGRVGKVVYLGGGAGPGSRPDLRPLEQALRLAETYRRLHSVRLGLIGEPSDWLVASMPDPDLVTSAWGPEIVRIGIDEVLRTVRDLTGADAGAAASASEQGLSSEERSFRDGFAGGATAIREPSGDDLTRSAAVYAALRRIARRDGLGALTVRCFDLVLKAGTSGCLALSALTDEGTVSGCEGDLEATLTMMILHYLSGETPFMANPARLDAADGSVWLAHCTIGRNLLEAYAIRSHFESGIGVGIQGTMRNGPVTLARVGGDRLDRLYVAEGELVASGHEENLCRTQAHVKLDGGVDYFLRRPLGNHHVLIYGRHKGDLAAYADLVGVELVG